MFQDDWSLYASMLRCRLFEETVAGLWDEGRISGEMHLGTGEEAINVGVITQLRDGDAMALDHRGSAPLLLRGVDPILLLREFLGQSDGLCGGRGGHMHLFSRAHLAASSGIIGASGPGAVGFALAAKLLRPGSVAVAFFGEGAMNQGMLLESFNLASAWHLPLLFVCKDDDWSITTPSESATGGDLLARARSFGLRTASAPGWDVQAVRQAAYSLLEETRNGGGPSFLHAPCIHLEGHFLGYQPLRLVRRPWRELPSIAGRLVQASLRPQGAPLATRAAGVRDILALLAANMGRREKSEHDPVYRLRKQLRRRPDKLADVEYGVVADIQQLQAELVIPDAVSSESSGSEPAGKGAGT